MIRYSSNAPLEYDEKIMEQDKYTFAVLSMILKKQCARIVTDDQNFILCLSAEPFPVWLWTVDGISEEAMEQVYRITMEEWPPEKFHYNLKHEAAEYFLKKRPDLHISMNMMTYECLQPVAPKSVVGGHMRACEEADLDLLVEWMLQFQEDVGIDKRPAEEHREGLREKIGLHALFMWVDENEVPVSLCGFRPGDDGLARLGPVFTPADKRRRHYAEHLVYEASCAVMELGQIPILYTNADYEASNACYRKVGYSLRGTLCTVEG